MIAMAIAAVYPVQVDASLEAPLSRSAPAAGPAPGREAVRHMARG